MYNITLAPPKNEHGATQYVNRMVFAVDDLSAPLRACPVDHRHAYDHISRYLRACLSYISAPYRNAGTPASDLVDTQATAILSILSSHEFNYRSRGQVAHLLPEMKQTITRHVAAKCALQLYLDLGGGYHASAMPDHSDALSFNISAAELLLIYQITRLKNKIDVIYPPGIEFTIIIDNGVACYANGIALQDTLDYCQRLRTLIARLSVEQYIRIMPQSEVSDFSGYERLKPLAATIIAEEEHRNVERFIGRACAQQEACDRVGRYRVAEALWEQELRTLISASKGIRLLQRGSDEYLSFRPFPGGAARIQCGRIGFREQSSKFIPILVTSNTYRTSEVVNIPIAPDILAALTA